MALTLAAPPAEGLQAVARALADLAERGSGDGRRAAAAAGEGSADEGAAEEGAAGEGAVAAAPIPIFQLGVDGLLGRRPLAAAQAAGWRYLVKDEAGLASADIAEGGGGPALVRLRRGKAAEALLEAARRAEAGGRPGAAAEVRILVVPELRVEALWLAGAGYDRLIPLRGGRAASGDSFVRRLRRALRPRLAPTAIDDYTG